MKVLPINNTSFKAYICNDYTLGEHKENYWEKLVQDCRRTGKDKELHELLNKIKNNDSKDILAIEQVFPNSKNGSKNYLTIALYNDDKDVIYDRRKNPNAKPEYSINGNGIVFELGYGGFYNAKGMTSRQVCNTFNTVTDAIMYTLKEYLNKESWVHEQLTSNRLVSPKNYLQRFAKKIKP